MPNEFEFKQTLAEGARTYGLDLDDSRIDQLKKYMELLKDWNTRMNLTAIEEDSDIVIKHFIDSFTILPYLENKGIKMIDVGTGAGFPGIPVKIAYEKIEVTLLDSLEKRIKFMNEVVSTLGLKGIKTVHGRAEDFGVNSEYREKFDIAVARAVANLPVLLEYCLPFVKTGGRFIAMKGNNIEETEASEKALNVLGGEIEEIGETILPFGDMKRNIIIIRKLRQTPTKYPRKAGKPSKEPLI
ncbi:MAG: 16S rRNA (guanine(527)-N(7))-methyltransferase RsmG [Bacillota bacterium]|nr:16S rRNA (guanine(527)-N(7))-methyltransferase RsmG [Bacillota bacterium]